MKINRIWIPCAVSLSRIPLTTFAVIAAWDERWYDGFVLLSWAVFTDMADGTLARLLNARSEWGGKFIDPFSDAYMGFVSMLGLAFKPDKTLWLILRDNGLGWAMYMPTSFALSVVLKHSKHADSNLWRRRISNAALPLCYSFTIIAELMAYASRISEDDMWVYQTAVCLLPMFAYLKRQRVKDWWNGKQ